VLDSGCLVETEAAELRAMVERRAPAGVELDA
jgi:hypothetical protein